MKFKSLLLVLVAVLLVACGQSAAYNGKYMMNGNDSEDWIELKDGKWLWKTGGTFSHGEYEIENETLIFLEPFGRTVTAHIANKTITFDDPNGSDSGTKDTLLFFKK